MKPLPRQDAESVRHSFQQIRSLLEQRNWSAAYESLAVLDRDSDDWRESPEYGEWCLLRAQSALETGRYREAVDRGRTSFAILQLTSDNERIGLVQNILGRAYLGLGDTKNARIHARDALATYRRLADDQGLVKAHNELAHIHFVRGEYELAIDQLEDALELARNLGDRAFESRLLGNLGRIHLLIGQWDLAESSLASALECAESAGNQASSARNLLSLALVSTLRHQFDLASERLEGALACIEAASLIREKAIYHEYSGTWHYEQRHWIQAKESFRRALNIGRRLSDQNDLVSQSLRGLAECEAQLGDWTQSRALAKEGIEIAIAIGERSEVGSLYRVLALSQAHLNESVEADACLQKALECLNAVGDIYELARCDVVEAEICQRDPARVALSVALWQRAAERYRRLGALEQLRDVQWNLVSAHVQLGELDHASDLAAELSDFPAKSGTPREPREILDTLAGQCVSHALSDRNEFRLGGTPWTPSSADRVPVDDLQSAIDFCRARIGASRVVLLEVTAEGKRTGRALAISGADDPFASRLAAFAAGTYHQFLPSDAPRIYWSVEQTPELAAYLRDEAGRVPHSVLSVPVELGPGAVGVLYADMLRVADSATRGFAPRHLDFAVAFAEIVAWQSTRLRSERLFQDVKRLRDQVGRICEFPSILTQNDAFRQVLSRVRLIVDADVAVLLQGETGTGKDLLAKAVHYSSVRREGRFVSVNCAALPESLLESELFGAKRGAYTGADRDKPGLFEEADGGTFFLDEIGEMPLSIQAKLLRLLESKELMRLGDTKPRRVNVRVLSATNRDLTEEIERGNFRRDLFYRLSALTFNLPPLRERAEDVPLLAAHFLARIGEESGHHAQLAPETIRVMTAYRWPGNIRELENELRKMLLLSPGEDVLTPERLSRKFFDLEAVAEVSPGESLPDHFRLYDQIAQIEQRYILRALAETAGIKKHAADKLGIPESTLRLKIRQYNLDNS
ncbi:MAG: sigma 54-interacting transcriptional regulator [candidate division Zixibacteria bacterium]|nr:sigma 54-interacting transcriptional regulator [candidate division Zixibacteria bacterium]